MTTKHEKPSERIRAEVVRSNEYHLEYAGETTTPIAMHQHYIESALAELDALDERIRKLEAGRDQ